MDGEPAGATPLCYAAPDERAEAEFVAGQIERLSAERGGAGPGDVAVLYRTRRQATEIAVALRARRLPYRVRGEGDLFARPEVRDAVAYLRLAHNPGDGAALARVVNTPPRRLARLAAALTRDPAGAAHLADRARPLRARLHCPRRRPAGAAR